jgi:hypothetical protein
MAIRAACASTGFTTATTWATVDTSVTSGTAATYLATLKLRRHTIFNRGI